MDFQLIWGAVALAALAGSLWGLARQYRSRLRYSIVLLAVCFVLLVLPQRQPWMHEAALALAQLSRSTFLHPVFSHPLPPLRLPVLSATS